VPELVFVNCCHLAARDVAQTLNNTGSNNSRPLNRAEFAWGVADSLIEIGVRCVIAAGWAVDDGPAAVFATTFYREILNRKPFITAVAAAREAAWLEDKNSNTWAAYQAYGDPNWTYRRNAGDEAAAPLPPREQFDGIASPLALTLALEEVAVQSKWMRADAAAQLEKIRHLEARFAALWGGMGAVAEAYGVAYAEAGSADQAIQWYQRALQCEDASASIKTHEQLGNQQARRGWARAAGAVVGSAGEGAALAQARDDINQALHALQGLAQMQPTLERNCLCGSASKRLALLERRAGNADAERQALHDAESAYARATALLHQGPGAPHSAFYPDSNRLALALVLQMGQPQPAVVADKLHAAAIAAVRQNLKSQTEQAPDFWSYAGLIEIDVYEGLAGAGLADRLVGVLDRYTQLHGRVAARSLWGSVADQAQLVLPPYILSANVASERAAAQKLLALLDSFAK
jgi:tetratricopeptide (TPR) repeat protein